MKKLDEALEKAKLACEYKFAPNTSIIERMRPWVHYNNLLLQKMSNLLKK